MGSSASRLARPARLRLASLVAYAAAAFFAAAAPAAVSRVVTVGRSVRGRPIRATVVGPRDAGRVVLVVGCVHGDEPAGIAVIRALRARTPPPGTALWLVRTFNPDGLAARTRQNARGVDLNRQAPYRWRALPRGTFYAGPRPLSEPESRAAVRLVRRLHPAVSIWYHQAARIVDGTGPVERAYARRVGLPWGRLPGSYPGSITNWQDHAQPRGDAFVVELPGGALAPASARRHAQAVLAAAAGR